MEEKDFTNYTFYWMKEGELSADEFIRLEQVAALENEIMKHRIFLGFKPRDDWPPSFISLN